MGQSHSVALTARLPAQSLIATNSKGRLLKIYFFTVSRMG